MLTVELVFILFLGWLSGHCYYGFNFHRIEQENNTILPWIGILRVESGTDQADAVTGLIMIRKHLAVGNANDVGKMKIDTLRKFAKAIFYGVNVRWECSISDCILHPEYFTGVKNTLALVYLSYDKEHLYWTSVSWPSINTTLENIYSAGFTDTHQRLHQVFIRMEAVMNTDCDDFYKKEKLTYKWMQPTYTICYKELNSMKRCVKDAGMALVVTSGDTWTLIGISTLGPGCSLPTRFIQFLPYIPWIKSLRRAKTQQNLRRTYEQGMLEPFEDQDTLLLQKINTSTIVMRQSLAYLKEEVHGRCDEIDGVLMYREYGTIRTPLYTATAVYSISLYDLFFPKITCVMVTVMCNRRSEIRFWVSFGFHQEDIEDYVKIIPAPSRNSSKAPRIWYIRDTYKKYRTIKTANLEFKFEFTNEAKMDLEFYGLNISSPMRPMNVPFLPKQKQISGKLPDGADFNARDDDSANISDTNDSFYHF